MPKVYHMYPCLRQENFSSPFTKRGIQVLDFHKLDAVDIDNLADWAIAEILYERRIYK